MFIVEADIVEIVRIYNKRRTLKWIEGKNMSLTFFRTSRVMTFTNDKYWMPGCPVLVNNNDQKIILPDGSAIAYQQYLLTEPEDSRNALAEFLKIKGRKVHLPLTVTVQILAKDVYSSNKTSLSANAVVLLHPYEQPGDLDFRRVVLSSGKVFDLAWRELELTHQEEAFLEFISAIPHNISIPGIPTNIPNTPPGIDLL